VISNSEGKSGDAIGQEQRDADRGSALQSFARLRGVSKEVEAAIKSKERGRVEERGDRWNRP
jgi:hypothetical protein